MTELGERVEGSGAAILKKTGDVFETVLGQRRPDPGAETKLLLARLQMDPGLFERARCLDAGSGRGEICRAMADLGAALALGVDAGGSLAFARSNTKDIDTVHLVKGNVLELPLADHSFDFVHCSGVLHHTTDPERGFLELVRVLRPGGVLYFAVVGKEGLQSVVTLAMRLLSKIVPLARMTRALRLVFPDWIVEGLLDVGYAPIRRTYTERTIRRWFAKHHVVDVVRTPSERYDYRRFLSRLWWGVGWIQMSGRLEPPAPHQE